MTAPKPVPIPPPMRYGIYDLPEEEDEGPPDGLTIDQAIELLMERNLDLRAKFLEIPQMRADVLTASLRANPIFYADSQLVPYGSDSVRKPDGPTQYDINVSHPIDYSHKRRARTAYASRALKVMEAQYQNEVRIAIGILYNAFVDVLAAHEDIRALRVSLLGNDDIVRMHDELYRQKGGTIADLDQARSEREIVVAGLFDAEENLKKRKRVLGEILNLEPDEAERLEVRGKLSEEGPSLPAVIELYEIARDYRPDLASFRLGVDAALANVRLQQANRFSDAYLLYQPYTYQNNAPYGRQSGTSWAVGITIPLPVYNRNQGNIDRADQRDAKPAATGVHGKADGDGSAAGGERVSGERQDHAAPSRGGAAGAEALEGRAARVVSRGGAIEADLHGGAAEVKRQREGVSRFGGAAPTEHARPEHHRGAAGFALRRKKRGSRSSPRGPSRLPHPHATKTEFLLLAAIESCDSKTFKRSSS